MRIATATAAAMLTIAGCATTADLAPPVDAAMIAAAQDAGIGPECLERGRTLYLTKCTDCHSPERITSYAPARWPGILEKMSERAHLAPRELDDIRAYVIAVGRRAHEGMQ